MRLAIACFVALSVPSFAASPTSQYIFGSQANQVVPSFGQSWIGLMPRDDENVWANTPDTGTSYAVMPTTGTFSTFCVDLQTAPGSGAGWTWTLYKDGSDSPITVAISGAQTQACDLVDTVGFVPGDLVALHVTPSSSPAPADTSASWFIVQTPQIPGETILFSSQQANEVAGNTQWLSLAGNSISTVTGEAAAGTIIPAAGKITKFAAEYVGTGSPSTAVLDKNGAPTSLSALMSVPGELFPVPGNLSVSAGDVFDVSETGISATTAVYASVVFVPDVAGQFVIPTSRNTVNNSAPAFYLPITGKSNGSLESREISAQQIGDNLQIQGMYVLGSIAPGSGAQYAFTLRDNLANTTLTTTLGGTSLSACTTSAPAPGCSSGAAVAVNSFDLLDTAVVPTGGPADTGGDGIAVSYLAYVPQLAFAPPLPAIWTTVTPLSPVVQLEDADGNPITGSTAQVTLSSNAAGVSTMTANAVNGVATFSNITFSAFGNYTLTASASGLSAITTSISIPSGPANKLVITTEPPATGIAGTPLSSVVVQIEDVNGNVVAASSAPVTISSTPTGVGGTLTVNAVKGVATFSNLLFTATGSYTLSASTSGLSAVTSNSISIVAGAASKLLFATEPPTNGTAGTAFGAVVQVEDAYGNLATASTAAVTISSTPAGVSGTLAANAVNGVATFSNLVFTTAGSYTLSAASTGLPSANSSSIAIAGVPSKLVFTREPPSSGMTGTALGAVIYIEDANGNLVTTSTAAVTISSTPAGVSGTLTVNAVNGVATFSNLIVNTPGTFTLTATSTGLPSVNSSSILMVGPASKLVFATEPPANGTAGTALGAVIQVEDANGSLVTNSTVAVTISSTPAGVSGTLTVSAVNGVATFGNLDFTTSGTYTLSASATGLSGATSTSISVAAPFTVTGTAVSVAPGATSVNTSTITVTPVGGFTGSVTLTAAVTSSPAGAVYPPTFSFGSTSPLNITGATAGTGTLTISTTAATSSALHLPNRPGVPWYAAGGVAFACLVFFGIPSRRRSWRSMLGMLALLFMLTGGLIACAKKSSGDGGGGGGGGGGGIAGTTAGAYTITVTGTSGTTTETDTITLTVQ
jgi:hypothetical protein